MSPYQSLAFQVALFVAVVSGQVALARKGRPIGAVLVAVCGVLTMVGVSYAVLRSYMSSELPSFVLRDWLPASATFTGIVLLGPTVAALWLARHDPRPRTSTHWAITAAAGLVMYVPAELVRPIIATDMMIATDEGTGTRGVWHPTPEERLARARTLPVCSIHVLDPRRHATWRWQTVRPVVAQLPMPREMHDEPDEVPNDPGIQQWGHERWGSIVLQLDGEAQQSSGFFIGGDAGTVSERPCALRIGARVVPITRTASTVRRRGAPGVDSMFTATTDVPIVLPDTQLGVGITARTRAGRDTLLSILAAMRFVDREHAH